MRILFLSRWLPYPPSNGSKLRIFHLLSGLAQRHEVDLITFADEADDERAPGALEEICGAVTVVPWRGLGQPRAWAQLGYLNATPRYYLETYSTEMRGRIQQALAQKAYDLVIASQIDMAAYGDCLGGIPALFEEAEVGTLYGHYRNAPSWPQRLRKGLTWRKHRRYLKSLMQNYALCTVASAPEQALLQRALYGEGELAGGANTLARGIDVAVVPNGVDVAGYAQQHAMPQMDTLIFTGSFHYAPNYEAMCWFSSRVLPLVRTVRPNVRLTITGRHDGFRLPDAPNVHLTGFVEDVRPLVARAWISVAPLHTGGGTRLKILEAMALGTPVIATSKGAEGLDAEAGKHLLIADAPADFVQAVLRLLQNEALRRELAQNALELVQERYDWAVILPQFLDVVEKVARHE